MLHDHLPDYDVLVLPGYRNSGPAHWQTLWEQQFPAFRRVQQQNWQQPRRQDWIKALDAAVDAAKRPVILVAHSLGVITTAHWAARFDSGKVAGALLVAPADVERNTASTALKNFAPIPRQPLPFSSLLIGSSNDPCCSAWRAAELAEQWGSHFHLLENAGHINADSNLGLWEPGLGLLADLLNRAGPHYRQPYENVTRRFLWVA